MRFDCINFFVLFPGAVSHPKKKFHSSVVRENEVVPALGNTWSHCVNTRIVAQFIDSNVRQLTIVKSPVAPNAAVRYTLDESGIILTGDDIEFVNVLSRNRQSIATKNKFLTSEITAHPGAVSWKP
ncbi:hypothetical protein JTE90_025294 [Oedothorax gibbosus]|uniref:Uncharacterized protein n=1 Tax=Oedothorax gibbosus TaxID=931172 RepID=A0AAV6V829_9ARAC|nr:hypothetical protein JTE90_025294 [Oedothorax gibbosus]